MTSLRKMFNRKVATSLIYKELLQINKYKHTSGEIFRARI